MKIFTRKRIYVNLVIAAIISLLMTFPMVFDYMGFSPASSVRNTIRPEFTAGDFLKLLDTFIFYGLMIFTFLIIYTYNYNRFSWPRKIILAFAVAIFFYFLSPVIYRPPEFRNKTVPRMEQGLATGRPDPRYDPEIKKMPRPNRWMDLRRAIEFSFILAITGLIGKIFELSDQGEQIKVENEKLRAENLQSQYSILVNQVNPHFFFNSMNSLSALVREGRKDNALRYIGELSNNFRYVLQNSGRELVTLEEEMKSLSGFCYMMLIRYEGKLFFNTEVNESLMNKRIPVFSLQPLIENAVKHNTMTEKRPLTVFIKGNDDNTLTITNKIIPRRDKKEVSGTGLRNLTTRYRLLTGKEIRIMNDGTEFQVILPLVNGDEYEGINS